MKEPYELTRMVEEIQSLYAELFVRLEKTTALEPINDEPLIAELTAETERAKKEIDERMKVLQPELMEWKDKKEDFPEEVNTLIQNFIDLLDQGLRECLDMINKRSSELKSRLADVRKAIVASQSRRQGAGGYKRSGHPSPRLFDRDA